MLGITPEDMNMAYKLLTATFLGGLIGFEREAHGKEAGFRTYALVCLGSALIMVVSVQIFEIYQGLAEVDPGRVAAQVVSGVGFLGAGAIIRYPQGVKGLTTAAGIWTAAGIGLACGIGAFHSAIVTTVLALLILIVFSKVNRMLEARNS